MVHTVLSYIKTGLVKTISKINPINGLQLVVLYLASILSKLSLIGYPVGVMFEQNIANQALKDEKFSFSSALDLTNPNKYFRILVLGLIKSATLIAIILLFGALGYGFFYLGLTLDYNAGYEFFVMVPVFLGILLAMFILVMFKWYALSEPLMYVLIKEDLGLEASQKIAKTMMAKRSNLKLVVIYLVHLILSGLLMGLFYLTYTLLWDKLLDYYFPFIITFVGLLIFSLLLMIRSSYKVSVTKLFMDLYKKATYESMFADEPVIVDDSLRKEELLSQLFNEVIIDANVVDEPDESSESELELDEETI